MSNPYETPELLGEYMLFHYGLDEDVMPWSNGPKEGVGFPSRTISELIDPSTLGVDASGLDVGCAVGRSTFELGSFCSQVKGVDLSSSFIEAANRLVEHGRYEYRFLEEGDLFREGTATVSSAQRARVGFVVADACNLSPELGAFDVVHAANLLCRLPRPDLFLNNLPNLVKPGGQLLLATPFTWLEEFTPRENWLGSGNSEEGLTRILSPFFEREERKELPFVIREHRRKFQFSVSLGTRWRRLRS
jgi:putative 4-mercaptohistidine N1-methyltranferase